MVVKKLDLGSLFDFKEEPKKEKTASVFGSSPITEERFRNWKGKREGVGKLIAEHVDIADAFRATASILEGDLLGRGDSSAILVFEKEGKLHMTESAILIKKTPAVLKSLRDNVDAVQLFIKEKTSKAQRKYWDFEIVSDVPQKMHNVIEGVCWGSGGVTDVSIRCENIDKTTSFVCTREKGHSGLHHGAGTQTYCAGSWR